MAAGMHARDLGQGPSPAILLLNDPWRREALHPCTHTQLLVTNNNTSVLEVAGVLYTSLATSSTDVARLHCPHGIR